MTIDFPPDDLHPLQYGRAILEEGLGWPATKPNLELVAECIVALEKSRRLTSVKAYKYLLRAITLAKEQGITVDHYFFTEGKYTVVRPEKPNNGIPLYKPIDKEALAREQATPEWQAANAQARATLAKLAGRTAMP